MRYKVVLYNASSGGGSSAGVGFTFYRKADAIAMAEYWSQVNAKLAYLWDGSTFTTYAPTP